MSKLTVVYEQPATEELTSEASTVLSTARDIVIDSQEMYVVAGDELAKIKARAKQIDTLRKSITKPLDEAKHATMEVFRPVVEALEEGERILKLALATYVTKQEQLRLEEKKRLEAAAAAERKSLDEQAAALAKEGRIEEAQATAAMSAVVTAPAPVIEIPKVKGTYMRDDCTVLVTDLSAFYHFLGDHPEYQYLADAKLGELKKLATKQGNAFVIPGCSVERFKTVASRAA